MSWAIWPCMSQPPKSSVTKPTPASHSRRASSICWARRLLPYRSRVRGSSRVTSNASRARLSSRSYACVSKLSRPCIRPVRSTSRLSVSNACSRLRRSARRSSVTWRFMLLRRVAAGVERGVGGAEPAGAVAEDAAEADVVGQAGRGVVGAAMAGHDRADAGLVLALAVVGRREIVAGHDPVRAAAVAAVVWANERTNANLSAMRAMRVKTLPSSDAGQVGWQRRRWCCGIRPARPSSDRRFRRASGRRRARARRRRCCAWAGPARRRERGRGAGRAASGRPCRGRRFCSKSRRVVPLQSVCRRLDHS